MALIVWGQLAYGALATAYNVASLERARRGRPPLSPTDARVGLAVMLTYTAAVSTGLLGWSTAHAVASAVALVVLGSGGFLRHIGARPRFASTGAWVAALALNGTGAALNLAALTVGSA